MPARRWSSRPTAAGARGKVVELKQAVDEALDGGCDTIQKVLVLKRTGAAGPHGEGPRRLVVRRRERPGRDVRAGLGERGAPALPAVHLRLHGQAQGHPALDGGLPAQRQAHGQVDLRLPRGRRLLVHGGRGLGHGPHLRVLRAAGGGRDHRHVRGRAGVSGRRPLLEHLRAPGRHDLLHGAHGDPRADEAGRRHPEQLRPVEAAPAGHGGRAHQPGGLDLVPHGHRQDALPDRGHLVADGDGRRRWRARCPA